jgi:hypothetical protein
MKDFFIQPTDFVITNNLKRGSRNIDVSGFKIGTYSTKIRGEESPPYLNAKTLIGVFGSLSEFIKLIQGPFNSTKDLRYDSSITERGGSWTEYSTYEELLDVVVNRPQELVNFKTNELQVNDGEESGKEVYFDVTGDFLDIGRYLDGVPEVFGTNFDGKHRGKRIKFIINANSSCRTDASSLTRRSQRVARLIDWLEYQGIRCSVNVVFSNDNAHNEILVKDFQDPLNIADIAVTSHGDFFRRLDFRFKEHSLTVDGGYGYAREFIDYLRRNKTLIEKSYNDLSIGEFVVFVNGSIAEYGVDEVDDYFDRIEEDLKKAVEDSVNHKQVMIFD